MKKILISVAVIVLAGSGWFALSRQNTQDDAMTQKESAMVENTEHAMMPKDETTKMTKDIVVALGVLNASGQAGTATLSDMKGKTKVTVEISGGVTDVPQPSHIHLGSCSSVGAIVYPLSSVVNGKAETILDVSLATLGSKLPLAIMVHKSKEEAKVFVSCGDLPKDGLVATVTEGAGGAMVDTKADVMIKGGTYSAYSANKVVSAGDNKVLLFFYANWCPLCRPLDADINAHLSSIPANIVILKVDYDTETALKQKYGVTYQHTIVEVDSRGALIKKWSVDTPTLSALIANIK